jgi:hypothetical protein
VERRKTWGENRVYYHDESGNLKRIATQWTSLAAADAFVMTSAGRSNLRVADLLQLVVMVEQQRNALRPKRLKRGGKGASRK